MTDEAFKNYIFSRQYLSTLLILIVKLNLDYTHNCSRSIKLLKLENWKTFTNASICKGIKYKIILAYE